MEPLRVTFNENDERISDHLKTWRGFVAAKTKALTEFELFENAIAVEKFLVNFLGEEKATEILEQVDPYAGFWIDDASLQTSPTNEPVEMTIKFEDSFLRDTNG